jgi:hypothetical protein
VISEERGEGERERGGEGEWGRGSEVVKVF